MSCAKIFGICKPKNFGKRPWDRERSRRTAGSDNDERGTHTG